MLYTCWYSINSNSEFPGTKQSKENLCICGSKLTICPVADPGFPRGSTNPCLLFWVWFCVYNSHKKWSSPKQSQPILAGVQGLPWDPGSSCIFSLKYTFPHFSYYFFFKFLTYVCVGTLQNIYFNMKDYDHFDKGNFPFVYLRKWRVLFVQLVLFVDTLLCKPGVWGLLRVPEAVETVKDTFPTFPGNFS